MCEVTDLNSNVGGDIQDTIKFPIPAYAWKNLRSMKMLTH